MKNLILKNNDEIRVITDPYRMDIIQVFRKNNNLPMTVKQVADILGEPHGKVYYHMKKMLDIDALALEKTEVINGIVAKYYKLSFEHVFFENESDIDKQILQSHVALMVAKMYDDSKKSFLAYIEGLNDEKRSTSNTKGAISTTNLFFDQESLNEFQSELEQLINRYSKKTEKTDIQRTFFHALYIEDNKID